MMTWIAVTNREFASATEGTGDRIGPQRGLALLGYWILPFALVGVASGGVVLGSGLPQDVTPAYRDVWRIVAKETPPDALIFTDQTGSDASRLGGWNDFALQSGRQFYMASWATSGRLMRDREKLRQRLTQNLAVLKGDIHPSDLSLSRAYSCYYAVVSNSFEPRSNFELVYKNARFGVYRIPGTYEHRSGSDRR